MTTTLLVEAIDVDGEHLAIRPGAAVRALLTADPWVRYPAGTDLAGVPRTVLVATAAYLLAPLVWAHGLDVALQGADTSVASALPRLQTEMRRMYPTLAWDGAVTVVDPVAPIPLPPPLSPRPGGRPIGLMLSGGVDSVSSALRHADGELVLLTVALDDDAGPPTRWARTVAGAAAFAAQHGHSYTLVSTNARSMVAPAATRRLRPAISHWWPEVAHAMDLAGVAAPALWLHGADRLLIASSDVPGHDSRWGSTARFDPMIGLGPITVAHDAHDGQRLDKVARIVASAGAAGGLPLRVCYKAVRDDRLNCGVCEKCLRTQAALVLCDADPARFGFPDPVACALALTANAWADLVAQATRGTIIHWATMGRAARAIDPLTRPPATRAFLRWLATLEAGTPPLGDPIALPWAPAAVPTTAGPGPITRARRRLRRAFRRVRG